MAYLTQVKKLMDKLHLDGIFIAKRNNFAWLTGGKDNYINNGSDEGVAYLYITPTDHYIVTNNIEMPRIVDEEIGDQGYLSITFNWYETLMDSPFAELSKGKTIGSDCNILHGKHIVNISAELAGLRSTLDTVQMSQYRWLALHAAEVIEKVCRVIEPGWTEQEIRGEVAREAHRRSLNPMVILIATDERIYKYRHPIATYKILTNYAMIVICAEKNGLIANVTRLVHFGPLPAELAAKAEKVAYIDAGMIANTKAGVSYKKYFSGLRDLYAEVGYPEEWKLHHQGGPTGYDPRLFLATPTTKGKIFLNQAFAWNPSITGSKSEDTILLTEAGPEVITQTPDWPTVAVNYKGKEWLRPAILIR